MIKTLEIKVAPHFFTKLNISMKKAFFKLGPCNISTICYLNFMQVDLWQVKGCCTGFIESSNSTLMIQYYTVFNIQPFNTNEYIPILTKS